MVLELVVFDISTEKSIRGIYRPIFVQCGVGGGLPFLGDLEFKRLISISDLDIFVIYALFFGFVKCNLTIFIFNTSNFGLFGVDFILKVISQKVKNHWFTG